MVTATNLNPDPPASPSGHIGYHKILHVAVNEVTALLSGITNFAAAVRSAVPSGTYSADILTDGDANHVFTAADDTRVTASAYVIVWNATAKTWATRPAGIPAGMVCFRSTNDAGATPPSSGQLTGDIWERHPDAA